MSVETAQRHPGSVPVGLVTLLPGPDRKRRPVYYLYRLVYRAAHAAEVGCVMLWKVEGGRGPYQIAVERGEEGQLRFHCSCADAIFRSEPAGRFCKHIKGFLRVGSELQEEAEAIRWVRVPA